MNYITLDLEWNQAYQEKALAVQKRLSSRLRGEVIQIGAVKMDEKGNFCGSYSITVKPRYYKKILRHVASLTGITQERADRGVSLAEAAESFHRFCGKDFVFLTWGPDDIPMLKDNFRVHGIDGEWLSNTYDLQPIFNRQTVGGKNQKSLEFAMEYFGIPQDLPAHDALNDAYFTALVAQKLDLKKGIAELKNEHDGDAFLDTEIGNADVGEDGFVEIRELLASKELEALRCPFCEGAITRERFAHCRGQRYDALVHCEKDGVMLLRLKLCHNFNDTWRAHVRILPATEDVIAAYRERTRESTAKKRPRRRHSRRGRSTAKPGEAAVTAESTSAV